MEKFGLLNLIRALSGQSEQSIEEDIKTNTADGAKEKPPAQKPPAQNSPATQQANILAEVIERHDKISYRIKNNRNKK